jgi:ADP-ribosyl-[dinitrogen reductase] hydrolase
MAVIEFIASRLLRCSCATCSAYSAATVEQTPAERESSGDDGYSAQERAWLAAYADADFTAAYNSSLLNDHLFAIALLEQVSTAGLGRAGMAAARLLIELGMNSDAAITAVRQVRPGAIETPGQVRYVRALGAISKPHPATTPETQQDRALGAVLGLGLVDAVGTTYEFRPRDRNPLLIDMVGGGPFRLKPGEWTDDTAMALALMDSLLAHPELDEPDLMSRFVDWSEAYSCNGKCFDIGITTRQALARFKSSGNPFSGSIDPRSAGNGSLMRLAPVAVRHWRNRDMLRDIAARQSRTTHGAAEAVDACVAFAGMLADGIASQPHSEVLRASGTDLAG